MEELKEKLKNLQESQQTEMNKFLEQDKNFYNMREKFKVLGIESKSSRLPGQNQYTPKETNNITTLPLIDHKIKPIKRKTSLSQGKEKEDPYREISLMKVLKFINLEF